MDPAEMLRRGFTRETAIRRDAEGHWWNAGERLDQASLERAFDGWIDRAPDGRFCLANDINWAFVDIEGPPYFVRSVDVRGDEVTLRLSGDHEEPLAPMTLRLGPGDALWCDVRGGRVPARFDDHAVQQLSIFLDEDDEGPYFRLGGTEVRPPEVADPFAGWDPSKGHVEP